MSLPERTERVRLRSLYFASFVALLSVLAVSFLAYQAISKRVQKTTIDPVFDRADEVQLQGARGALQAGNKQALEDYEANLNRIFGGSHYLLDAHGIDVLTGQDRSALLPAPPSVQSRFQLQGRSFITHRSQDGRYWFLAVGVVNRSGIWSFLPYYFLVIGATGVLFWLAAVGVVGPIRRIAGTIALFGEGNLGIRVDTRREDEIGQLGRSFNDMAMRLERLIVSERRLLSDISHELRSPLARLKFATKLARTSPDTKYALDRIERDVDRITSLVTDILEINFVEGSSALEDTQLVHVGTIVDEVVQDATVEVQFRGCTIKVAGQIARQILGNRELLRRAIENVLRNGIRYAPENSQIHLTMMEDASHAIITVRDFGPGVPTEALTRIFDPFFRVEEARDAMGGGSGLGLSIAKRAVHLHRGNIAAENAHPGLRMRITIPLATMPTSG